MTKLAHVSAESTLQTNGSRPPRPSSTAPVTRATVLRDQGTSPVHFLSYNQPEFSHGRFQPIYEDVDYQKPSRPLATSVVPQLGDQDRPLPPSSTLHSSSSLDQLWGRFCAHWSLEDSRASEREASLLERLERLSRLIHNTRGSKAPAANRGHGERAQRRDGEEEEEEDEAVQPRRVGECRKTQAEPPLSRQAWRTEEPSQTTNDSLASACSLGDPHRLCPADGDETSETAGSVSTVDTARLVRAFGSHRVQLLKTSSSLRKLYSTIDEQKERREERGGRTEEQLSLTASWVTEDSAVSSCTS